MPAPRERLGLSTDDSAIVRRHLGGGRPRHGLVVPGASAAPPRGRLGARTGKHGREDEQLRRAGLLRARPCGGWSRLPGGGGRSVDRRRGSSGGRGPASASTEGCATQGCPTSSRSSRGGPRTCAPNGGTRSTCCTSTASTTRCRCWTTCCGSITFAPSAGARARRLLLGGCDVGHSVGVLPRGRLRYTGRVDRLRCCRDTPLFVDRTRLVRQVPWWLRNLSSR